MFGSLGAPEIAIIAVVIILIFGVGKISGLGRELGTSIKEFRRAVKEEDKEEGQGPPQANIQQAPPQQPAGQQSQQQPPAEPPAQRQGDPQGKTNLF
ncbi:MAG: hypothetical protein Kow0010_14640 [Dehalococcoidia bacterium]